MGNDNRTRQENKPVPAGKKQLQNSNVDLREQLYNGGEIGSITSVQLEASLITSHRGILFDIDPKYQAGLGVSAAVLMDPEKLYHQVIKPMLNRHSTLAKAEVRDSGSGLHVILRLKEPVQFKTAADRNKYASIVKALQCILLSDPNCQGLTALTRPIGSTNSKNDRKVSQLTPGEAIPYQEILDLHTALCSKPFGLIASILFGKERISPCPICKEPESSLSVLDTCGKCYGPCGEVDITRLFNALMIAPSKKKGGK